MATGLKCYNDDPANTLITDMTRRLSQNIGYVDTGAVNGSITVPAPPAGRSFFYVTSALDGEASGGGKMPGVTVTNNGATYTLSWAYSYWQAWGNYSLNTRISYGFY